MATVPKQSCADRPGHLLTPEASDSPLLFLGLRRFRSKRCSLFVCPMIGTIASLRLINRHSILARINHRREAGQKVKGYHDAGIDASSSHDWRVCGLMLLLKLVPVEIMGKVHHGMVQIDDGFESSAKNVGFSGGRRRLPRAVSTPYLKVPKTGFSLDFRKSRTRSRREAS
jgi:hypothetical protein